MWRAALGAGLLALAGAAHAQQPIAIAPEGAPDAVVAPRSMVAVALRVTNHSGAAGVFATSLALPPGWRAVTADAPFALARGASTVRMVSLFVPEAAAAGDHVLSYGLRDHAVHGEYAVHVHVAATLKLALTLLDMPEMVVAGAAYAGTFQLKNSGNAPATIAYKAHSSRGYALDLPPGAVTLPPGASRTFTIHVNTAPVTALERDWLVLAAQVQDGAAVRATGVVELIPRVTGAERRYETVPATASLRYVSANDNGRQRATVQADVAGGGKLGESGARYLDFLLRGPGADTASGFGERAEYRVAYRDPALAVVLGDGNVALSPLTEAGSFGRGASASWQGESVSVRAYAMRDPYARVEQAVLPSSGPIATAVEALAAQNAALANTRLAEQALGLGYASPLGQVGVNILRKTDDRCATGATVASVRDQLGSAAGFAADVEVGQSACAGVAGKAWRVALADHRYRLTWQAAITQADAGYKGYNPDQQLAAFSAGYSLTAAWSLHASYRAQQTNLARDPSRAALDETQTVAGAGYRFAGGARADVDYLTGVTADLRAAPDYDAHGQAVRASLSGRYHDIALYGSASVGRTFDRVRATRFPTRQLLTSAFWSASAHLALGANLYYIDNAYSTRLEAPQTAVGATVRYAASARTTFDANVQENRAGAGGSTGNLTLSHRLANGDVMTLAMRRLTVGATKQGDLMLSYAMAVGVPVGRRHDVATVDGRVRDHVTGRGVPGKLLRLGGIVAVSGAGGAFSFPSIPLGTYYLSMDEIEGAGGTISLEALPMAVDVHGGGDTHLDIALVKAATMTGAVTLAAPGAADTDASVDAAPLPAPGLLRNVLVIFRRPGVEFRRLTDASGQFRLGSIAPGQWTVSVDPASIPAGYMLARDQLLVDLAPGADTALSFQLAWKHRAIRMQQLMPVGS